MSHIWKLKRGATFADMLDDIEGSVVRYMRTKRGIDEVAMRRLLEADQEVKASYGRKIERMIQGMIDKGVHPSVFGRAA